MTDAKSYVVNVEVAIYRDGEYLLAERAAAEDHAAGELALVGGTVEAADEGGEILRSTVRREVREEIGCEITDLRFVTSSSFVADTGAPVVNVVFVAAHESGRPRPRDPEEVASLDWYDPVEVEADPSVPPYTTEYVLAAEEVRRESE